MKSTAILILAFSCFLSVQAQDSLFRFSRSIPGYFSTVYTDYLGNIYAVTTGNQLRKFNEQGDSVAVFNNVRRYGSLTFIDVTNPLKLLLYYESYATVQVLDRFLDSRHTINLRQQGIFNVKTIGSSYDNNIWVFDEADAKLKKVDETGTVLTETNDLRQVLDTVPSPGYLYDQDGLVFLYDTNRGWYVFDNYGSFKNRIPFTGWSDVQVIGGYLMGFSGNQLMQYQPGSMQLRSFVLPPGSERAGKRAASPGTLVLMHDNALLVYRIR